MSWKEWCNHESYNIVLKLKITEWINFDKMIDEEKIDYPKAYICEGYLKKYSYHEAWKNLWDSLSDNEKNSFKTLPNYDPNIFEEITGIRLD